MSHGPYISFLHNTLNYHSYLDSIIAILPALPTCSVYLFYLLPEQETVWASQELYHIPTAVSSDLSKFVSHFLAATVSTNDTDSCKCMQAYCRSISEIPFYLSKLFGSKEEKDQTNNFLSYFLRKGDQKGLLSHFWKAGIYKKRWENLRIHAIVTDAKPGTKKAHHYIKTKGSLSKELEV